jgi:hypothetical protein
MMRKNWKYGFLGFLSIVGFVGLWKNRIEDSIWLIWLIWFVYFIPISKKVIKKEQKH